VESYWLVQEGGSPDCQWRLAWDDGTLRLTDPDGQQVLAAPRGAAHQLVEVYELYAEGKISFASPHGSLTFRKESSALAAVRRLVEETLAGDPAYCVELRQQSWWSIAMGSFMFVVCGGLFGLYCWYASWAPDPPPGHAIRWFGWLINVVLTVLMALGLAGPLVAYFGLRQWLRVRRIERAAADRTTPCR